MPVALLVAFLLVPLAELYVISRVGQVLGLPATLGVLLLVSVLGAALVKREGMRTWRALRTALDSGQMPARELANAALVLVGGMLLLTPGFLTDVVGLALVLPPTRAVVRRLLIALALRRTLAQPARRRRRRPGVGPTAAGRQTAWPSPPRPSGRIIEGRTVEGRNIEGRNIEGRNIEGGALPDPDMTEPRSR